MTATITYKGNTLATASNNTKVLETEGTYLEDDITITDVTSGTGTLITKSITANGTYNASSDSADGYSSVTVNVSGGDTPVQKKQVNFIDYDGTILYAYSKAEITAMSSDSDLPSNPSHTGLTSQGWNWTLAQIKTQLTAMPDDDVTVGQMYTTSSGATEIDVEFVDSARLTPTLTIAVNGTISVDWGDGTTADTVTGTSLTTRKAVHHTYANTGSYTISITATGTNKYTFLCSSSYLILRKNATANESRVYANCIKNVRIGNGIADIGQYAFYYCCSLESITIPSSVTSIANYAFATNPSMRNISIPSSVTTIGNNAFASCASLSSITIPSSVTSIGNSAFESCYGVKEYHIKPTTVPTAGTTIFKNIVSDCIIYVPSAKLENYKTASNWSTYASYMQGE